MLLERLTVEKGHKTMAERQKLLLHSCCGPCSTTVVERVAGKYDVTLFFYNPNITDPEEYERRKTVLLRFLKIYNEKYFSKKTVGFLEGAYDTGRFYEAVKGAEEAPEGGKRCEKCFELRLGETAKIAGELGFESFGTTLSVSPHKSYALISKIGSLLASHEDIMFLNDDFKKKAGYERSIALSKEYELYRQNYCGCEFSRECKR
ncbi:MAG: epoxyqueuosine reductase QueH [Clostridiales bacterium]|nr:epoxyqueuosine reductase QueH [Clostridiales bacterium]